MRKGLVLVIPHPDHVTQFLEAPDFEIVQGLAEKGQHDAPGSMVQIPFLSRFYNFTSALAWNGFTHAEKTRHKDVCHLILLSSAKSAVVRTNEGEVHQCVLVVQQAFCLKNTELIYENQKPSIRMVELNCILTHHQHNLLVGRRRSNG